MSLLHFVIGAVISWAVGVILLWLVALQANWTALFIPDPLWAGVASAFLIACAFFGGNVGMKAYDDKKASAKLSEELLEEKGEKS